MDTSYDAGAELDRATAYLQGGVRGPGMDEGLYVIEVWEHRLAASGNPELVPIAENLAALRTQLLSGQFEPAAVGRLMATLAEQTRGTASSDVGAPVADRLSELAALLDDQGNALSGEPAGA